MLKVDDERVLRVITYLSINKDTYENITQRIPYNHMGATITDAILQSGMNYKNVVYPRILEILSKYPTFKSTCDFIILFQTVSLEKIIRWNNPKKLNLIYDLTWFFYNKQIENEYQLSKWLSLDANVDELLKFNGIGYKTVDYLKLLTGQQAIPIDRHMYQFLNLAGVYVKSYSEASKILKSVAHILNIGESILDYRIWAYMSGNYTQ
jgi:endonuclease III